MSRVLFSFSRKSGARPIFQIHGKNRKGGGGDGGVYMQVYIGSEKDYGESKRHEAEKEKPEKQIQIKRDRTGWRKKMAA